MGGDHLDYYAIGQRIRKIRKARNMSQEQLADRIGISMTHMSHIETANTKLSLPVFVEIAEALGVQTDALLYDEIPRSNTVIADDICNILESCNTQQLRLIAEIVKSTKQALDAYL